LGKKAEILKAESRNQTSAGKGQSAGGGGRKAEMLKAEN
jgi:hypothetical protein